MSLENTPPTTPPNPFQPGAMPPAPTPPAPAEAAPAQSNPYAAPVAPPLAGPPAQGSTAPNAFSTIPARAWRGAVASAGIGYGAAFVVALLTVALTGLLTGWEMFSAGWLVSGPVQLVALATFGQLGASAEVDFFVSFTGSASVGVLPILVLAVLLTGTYLSSRFVGRGVWQGSSALILSAVSGLTLAVGVTVLAAVLPVQFPDLQLDIPVSSTSAASVASFLGALVAGFAVSYLARLQATDGWARLVARATWLPWGTVRIASLHLGAFITVMAVLLAILTPLSEADEYVGVLPVFLLTIAINVVVIGMLGAFSADLSDLDRVLASLGGASDEQTQQNVSVFSDGITGYVWLIVLLAVVLAVAASLLLAVRRNRVRPAPLSWLATIATYMTFGLILQLLGSALVTASMTAPGNASASGTFGPAAWTFLIFAIWGAAIEALTRFVAPTILATATPGAIGALVKLSGQERLLPVLPTAPLVPAGTVAADPAPAAAGMPSGIAPTSAYSTSDYPPAAQSGAAPLPFATSTLSPATAKRVKIGAIIVGAAALLIIAGSVAGGIVRTSVFGPQNVATAYLDALEKGNATTALKLLGSSADAGDGLLSNDIFGLATDRIEDAAISDVTIVGDVAQIEVHFKQGGVADSAVLKLTRTSTNWLIADNWSILNAEPGQIDVYTPSGLGDVELEANGTSVGTTTDDGLSLSAFPGTYEVTIPATDYFEESSVTYVVSGLLGGFGEFESSDDTFTASATAVYEAAALEAVNTLITTCLAAGDTESDECPYMGYSSSYYSNVTYTLVTAPELTVDLAYEPGGLSVSTDTYGVVNMEYDVNYGFSSETRHESAENYFTISADVNVVDGEVVVTSVR
ncbi:hypothetical protein E3O06_16365 [Cryobacterium glaciale]|uniref:DUF4878 domain-containing protein n=1 Tax=Cryobacterium glaciale TaxID=1259145 RepID=A0A4R8UN30_9MICO|nr:hypothetical protein [Cryobacterium glaciale]TFB68088.1 hypothetical protein E3O06_16365 [Cryobacterium glaciale]